MVNHIPVGAAAAIGTKSRLSPLLQGFWGGEEARMTLVGSQQFLFFRFFYIFTLLILKG
jgi:hypothetical protein